MSAPKTLAFMAGCHITENLGIEMTADEQIAMTNYLEQFLNEMLVSIAHAQSLGLTIKKG